MIGKTYVQKARGIDKFNYHEHTSRPTKLLNTNDLICRDKANNELKKILYKDAEKIGKY